MSTHAHSAKVAPPRERAPSGGRRQQRRAALITWVTIYPTITLLLYVFGPLLEPLPLPLRTFVLTAVLVPLMVFVLVPRVKAVADRFFRAP
ncbi:MAG: hypothetical protein AAF411_14785 [Myxococcota bacterium]